jgi:hypothetical protein
MEETMIRITVELLPFGSEKYKKKIASMLIINDASGTPESGNYFVKYEDDSRNIEGELKDVPRGKSFLHELLRKAFSIK